MEVFMEYMVPLIGIFIGNLLFNGFLMWLVITKIVGSSDDATYMKCVVCCFFMFLVMIICLFVLLFPLLGGIIYLVAIYKGCNAVIETVFELPDGRGRGILILFLILNLGVGWAVDKGLDSAKTGITYAQQGFMSQTEFAIEFEKQLRQRLEGPYFVEANGIPDQYYDVVVADPSGSVMIDFDAMDFYRHGVEVFEAVNRVEKMMDTLSGRKHEPAAVLMAPDAPKPPSVSPDAPQSPQPPTAQDDDVAVTPQTPQSPMAPQAPQPPQVAMPLASSSTEQAAASGSLNTSEATLKKVFKIEGDIPSLGIPCEYRRGARNDDEEW